MRVYKILVVYMQNNETGYLLCSQLLVKVQHKITDKCVQGVKHVLGYLQTTKDYGFIHKPPKAIDETTIHAYEGPRFANDTVNQKSTTGYVIMYVG
jgi:hypothetical protein